MVVLIALLAGSSARAQFQQGDPGGAKLGEALVQQFRCGVIVRAVGGDCRGIVGYTTVPIDWPEQEVQIVDEEISPEAKVSYVNIDDGAKMMLVRVPLLRSGVEAKAVVTFEIRRSTVLPPEEKEAEGYALPDLKKLDRKVRIYLGNSPKIETTDRKIRDLARKIGVHEKLAWHRVEAIYDWVRENVEYRNGPLKGAVAALKDGWGDCEELTSLFIAICRASDIPSRTVWVEGHCYPEFYLHDKQGKGHWFPCQAAGSRAFGGIPELRPILQKGDNIRPPKNRRERQRYLANHLKIAVPAGEPSVKFSRKAVSD